MPTFFLILLLLSLVCLITGLIKPSVFSKIVRAVPKRKNIALIFSGLVIVSFTGIGIFAPPVEKKTNETVSQDNIVETNTQTDSSEEVAPTSTEVALDDTDTVQEKEVSVEQPKAVVVSDQEKDKQYVYYSISSITDGDTIKINVNGTVETYRMIGMDTPEVADPRKPVQCFGKEASEKAKSLLLGKKVRIETDPVTGLYDKYNRKLGYLFREDGLFYNKYMIEQGYAHEYTYNAPYKYQSEFKAAQKYAQDNQLGFWSSTTCNGNTTQSVTSPTPQKNDTSQTTGKYYTSSFSGTKYYYPEACSGWKSLSTKNLKVFDSVEALLAAYPSRTLSPQCQ